MIFQDLFSPETIAIALGALGLGMAVNDSREEKNRQREEARAAQEAEREQKRLEHSMKVAEARAAREEEAAHRKAEMEAKRMAQSAERQEKRQATHEALDMRKAELEARAEEQRALRDAQFEEHQDRHAAAADHKSSFVDHGKEEISFVDESLMTDPDHIYENDGSDYIESEPYLAVPSPDQGILSGFHGDHVGKGVFSVSRIDASWPDESQVLASYSLDSALKVRLFLASSLRNLRIDLDDVSAFHPDLPASIRVDFILDGHVVSTFHDLIGNRDQLHTWTTWWYSLVPEQSIGWNASTISYEGHFGEMVENLSPGAHDFRIEWWMESDNDHGGTELLVEADLHLEFDAEQQAAWVARHGRVEIAYSAPVINTPAPVTPAFSYIRLTVQNSSDVDIKFELVQGAASGLQSLGRRTTTTLNLGIGDKILMNGSVVHIVSQGSDGQHLQLSK